MWRENFEEEKSAEEGNWKNLQREEEEKESGIGGFGDEY